MHNNQLERLIKEHGGADLGGTWPDREVRFTVGQGPYMRSFYYAVIDSGANAICDMSSGIVYIDTNSIDYDGEHPE